MAKRERKPLTQRERQCKKVAREKAARKLLYGCWLRVRFGLGAAVLGLVLAAGVWECGWGGVTRAAETATQRVWKMTARAGFTVQTMYLEGRARTPLKDVQTALAIRKGQPILALPLEEARTRLEALPTVKYASIERALPGTLYVKLIERDPVALWQHGGKLSLIDDEGTAMNDLELKDYQGLPVVTGEGAPGHVGEVLALLSAQPELRDKVEAAMRMGDRRWNLRLRGGIEIKLPERGALEAWNRVAQLEREQKLLGRAVRSVDLRAPDRMYIRLAPNMVPTASPVSSRET